MTPLIIALAILAITIVLFIWEPIPIIVTAIGASLAYAFLGLLETKEVFAGYNSNIIILLAAMMVIGASLFQTGVTKVIGDRMIKYVGSSERTLVLVTLIVSSLLSGVTSNIGVMVALAPLVTALAIRIGVGPSRVLISLLFGAQFGGFLTLIGVGSNAAAASVMTDLGYEAFGFFAITPFGIGVTVLGILYFAFIGMRFLPDTGYVPEFAKSGNHELNRSKASIAVLTLLGVLVMIAWNPSWLPMHIAAVIGALIIVAARCMTVDAAVKSIDWVTLALVGALSAISTGLSNSGAAQWLADSILKVLGDNPSPFLISTVIFFATVILTQFMSNIPTILVFLPVGITVAESIGVSPYPVAMIITLAGAASYATPFAAPQNMMTVGWTQYKFMDFVRIGVPMVFVTYLVIITLTPIFLPY